MDNTYLKSNVLPALSEALTAMAVQAPEDRVEFVGRYLLSFVERHHTKTKKVQEEAAMEKKLADFLVADQIRLDEIDLVEAPIRQQQLRYESFLSSVTGYNSKQDAFDAVTKFLETQLDIPAAYIATRYTSGETTDVLKYVSKGNNDPLVLGKKLNKPAAEDGGDEAPERQGVSFEAFKLPEVPESDEPPPEDLPEGQEPVVKPPPTLQPFSITNVMRDKRVKFFGIPKLGSYLAVPFTYPTVDHENAVVYTPAEGETPASFAVVKKDAQFFIACDTIGAFRLFKKEEIARVTALGEALLTLFQRIEDQSELRLKDYLASEHITNVNTAATEFASKIVELETAALVPPPVEAAAAPAPAEGAEGEAAAPPAPVEEAPEVKTARETKAVTDVWAATTASSSLQSTLGAALHAYEVGVPLSVLKLLHTIALLTAAPPADYSDRCGDASWASLRSSGFVAKLGDCIASYDPAASVTLLHRDQRFSAIKAFVEAQAVLDAGSFPAFLQPTFVSYLLPWLTKALAAREAQLALAALSGQELEIVGWSQQ